MGIAPITNLIPLQVARAPQPTLEPLPMERVQDSSRTNDETYSPSNGSSASGSEDDAYQDDFTDELVDDSDAELDAEASDRGDSGNLARPISFFA